jgi:D-amino-acid dehydrogenase
VKVAVIGAGIIGVTAAYELASDGHEVTVFERRGSVAAETSFANAGVVAPGHVTPWAAPGMPGEVLGRLLSRHTPVRVRTGLDLATIGWLWRWWRACRSRTYPDNRLRMQRLAYFSRDRLHRITHELKLDYERSDGYLVLLRTPKDLAMAQLALRSVAELDTRFETLDARQCRTVEPGLNPETALHAGIYIPDDEVGNCRQFAYLLRTEAQRLGASFRFHTQVQTMIAGRAPRLVHIYAPPQDSTLLNVTAESAPNDARDTQPMERHAITESFDAVVVCAALASNALLRPHGLALPMVAVLGCSITAPLRRHEGHPDQGPRSALMDERYKVAISRLGDRVRVAGGAEIGGSMAGHSRGTLDTLYKVLHDWFPGRAHLSQVQTWKGALPALPDGLPVIGRSGIEGVWLNLGHGPSGWALSCGSARLLADSLAGRPTAIDIEGLGIERLKA